MTIYEQTAVTSRSIPAAIRRSRPTTAMSAPRPIVLCGEAYLSQLPGYGRAVMPVYSLITLTEPLSRGRLGRDRLAEPGMRRLVPVHGRLPLAHRRRPDPLRRSRRALPLRLEDRTRDGQARRHAPDAAGQRPRLVPAPEGCPLHPYLGRPARLVARLRADRLLRSRAGARHWPTATPATASRPPIWPVACWPTMITGQKSDLLELAARQPQDPPMGAGALPLSSASASSSNPSCASTARPNQPASHPTARSWPNASPRIRPGALTVVPAGHPDPGSGIHSGAASGDRFNYLEAFPSVSNLRCRLLRVEEPSPAQRRTRLIDVPAGRERVDDQDLHRRRQRNREERPRRPDQLGPGQHRRKYGQRRQPDRVPGHPGHESPRRPASAAPG